MQQRIHHPGQPEALADHVLVRQALAGDEGAFEIRVHHRVPVLVFHAKDQTVLGDAGVVDEHVEPAVRVGDFLDRIGERFGVGNIDCRDFGAAAF